MTALVSDVVWAVRVGEPLAGLVTASSTTVTGALAAMLLPPKKPQVATRPVSLQEPRSVPEEFRTELASTVLRLVPEGKVIVIWLLAAAERAPVDEVLNWIEYTVRAPAAFDGELMVTLGWVMGLFATTE